MMFINLRPSYGDISTLDLHSSTPSLMMQIKRNSLPAPGALVDGDAALAALSFAASERPYDGISVVRKAATGRLSTRRVHALNAVRTKWKWSLGRLHA